MRLPIFVSHALASGVVSFAASACDTRVDYGNKINQLQTEYQAAVGRQPTLTLKKPCTVLDSGGQVHLAAGVGTFYRTVAGELDAHRAGAIE